MTSEQPPREPDEGSAPGVEPGEALGGARASEQTAQEAAGGSEECLGEVAAAVVPDTSGEPLEERPGEVAASGSAAVVPVDDLPGGFAFALHSLVEIQRAHAGLDAMETALYTAVFEHVDALSKETAELIAERDMMIRSACAEIGAALRLSDRVPRQVVGRNSSISKLGMVGLAVPAYTSAGRFQAIASCGRTW
ncbi:hypothetical protein ACQUSY_09625, partial [Microbacterium sp. YY-03]|uniref:hypothetical protein n=1 Tax=Microbacterium sp. YY-03 TaxID=3421636 RepID=UPI003D169D9F